MKRLVMFGVVTMAMLASSASAQRDMADAKITAEKVSGNVYMLTGPGGNIGVTVGEDGVIIIDDKFAPLVPKIRKAIADIGGTDLVFILNTHWHGDHVGGNEQFGPEATIIAHKNVRKRMAEGHAGRGISPFPAAALPVITFDSALSVHFNGEELRAIHLPKGHTDGDCAVYFAESNVLHMGDHFFAGMFPFVDLQSGGTVEGYLRNVEKMINEVPADTKVIPGHGGLSTIGDLKAFRDMLKETTQVIRDRMKKGENRDAIVAAGLPEKWNSYSWSFIPTEKWIGVVYDSYSN